MIPSITCSCGFGTHHKYSSSLCLCCIVASDVSHQAPVLSRRTDSKRPSIEFCTHCRSYEKPSHYKIYMPSQFWIRVPHLGGLQWGQTNTMTHDRVLSFLLPRYTVELNKLIGLMCPLALAVLSNRMSHAILRLSLNLDFSASTLSHPPPSAARHFNKILISN
jgi:hypothetical protein